MTDMFTNAANLKGLLENSERLKVFELHQSSSMHVDEVRAEFASGTSMYNIFSEQIQSRCVDERCPCPWMYVDFVLRLFIGIQPNTFVLAAHPACEPVIQFNVNRPFVYFLRNRIDDTILFSGRLVQPVLG